MALFIRREVERAFSTHHQKQCAGKKEDKERSSRKPVLEGGMGDGRGWRGSVSASETGGLIHQRGGEAVRVINRQTELSIASRPGNQNYRSIGWGRTRAPKEGEAPENRIRRSGKGK